jgi:uncharacterized RDD family membrane protein YckC
MTELLEGLRVVNVTLSIVAAFAFFIRINDVWSMHTRGGRALRLGLLVLLVTVAYGSAEAYVQHAAVGYRTPLVTISCALILRGLWLSRHDYQP